MEIYTSDSSDSDNGNRLLDFSFSHLEPEEVDRNVEALLDKSDSKPIEIEKLLLHHNNLKLFPENIFKFPNLRVLDVSNNNLTMLPDVFEYCHLVTLVAKNNCLKNESLPKEFSSCPTLKELNLSGNLLTEFPEQVVEFGNLKYLYLGGNNIGAISKTICKLKQLQILSLGGNVLTEVPATLGQIKSLQALVLCDNLIECLPSSIANLHQLKTLALHKNRIKVLPPEIVTLKNLTELSLRDNPLVVRFVTDMTYNPTSLLELAARTIKTLRLPIDELEVPRTLVTYLGSAQCCVNPKCKGVFFDNRVEHIKFVDFCGKYKIPLLEYLCSAKCISKGSERVHPARTHLMRKVLLG